MADLKPRASSTGRRARTVPARHLQEECRLLDATLRRAKVATPEEIDPYKPGGAANPARDAFGWLAFYKRLCRLHARQDSSVLSASAASTAVATVDDELLQRAQNEEPLRVDLERPLGDGTAYVLVRVLSGYALTHLDARDGLINCLARHATALKRSPRPSDHQLRMQCMDELAYQEGICQWIVTSDAAPDLPFDPSEDPRPALPEKFRRLDTVDGVRVFAAFHRLNGASLAILRRKVSIEDGDTSGAGRAGSWRTFTGMLETQSHHQVPARRFWRNRGLVALLASRYLAVQEEERQSDEAKRKAESEAKRGRR